ncbi:MAG: hypothetical protein COA32_10275 [Fluviicola sp.]|nr:MAG: hypothetical protein COA32_10275 [Fluviicola sp.]
MKKTLKILLRGILIIFPLVGIFYLIAFLFFMDGFGKGFGGDGSVKNYYGDTIENNRVVKDTILNWQFYMDSELLFKSNIVESRRYTANVDVSKDYESLVLKMFHDFSNEVIQRKLELVYNDTVLTTFEDKSLSRSPFYLSKEEVDKVTKGNVGKDIYIKYYDYFHESGLTIGILKFVE